LQAGRETRIRPSRVVVARGETVKSVQRR
jgi:hypothetical protein